jgi:two-component system sensor histidine kinase and response regulator WspE
MSNGGEFSLIELFQEEVRAHTATLNEGLLQLEIDPTNPQRIEPLMRGAHSIKGAARIVGIDQAVQLAHVMEDVFVAAQEGRIRIAPADIDQLLRGTDLLAELAGVTNDSATVWTTSHAAEISALCQLLAAVAQGQPSHTASHAPTGPGNPRAATISASTADRGESTGAIPPPRDVELSGTVVASPLWQRIEIPTEPIIHADDSPLLDLFREEIRGNSLAIHQGLQALAERPAEIVPLEPLLEAARAMRGAARIVGIAPAANLAEALEVLFTVAHTTGIPLNTNALHGLRNAVEILVELIAIRPETVPEWTVRRQGDILELCQRLSAACSDPLTVTNSAAAGPTEPSAGNVREGRVPESTTVAPSIAVKNEDRAIPDSTDTAHPSPPAITAASIPM